MFVFYIIITSSTIVRHVRWVQCGLFAENIKLVDIKLRIPFKPRWVLEEDTLRIYISVVLAILFVVSFMQSHQFCGSVKKVVEPIQNYFPHENCLCVVLGVTAEEEFLPMPTLHVPEVVFTKDRVLQDCGSKSTNQDGYIFMTSNAASLEIQIIPHLRCFNRSTLKLKTKYILITDFSDSDSGRYEALSFKISGMSSESSTLLFFQFKIKSWVTYLL